MRAAIATAALALVAGCAGVKTYPIEGSGNVALRPQLDAGVRAFLHVHFVGPGCGTEYQGRVELQAPSTSVAIPADRLSYLVVTFDTSSFLRGSSSTSTGSLLRPRTGQAYEIALRYRDGIYDMAIRETDRRSGASRTLARRELAACQGA
jgi:hypothetical protein